MLSTKFNLRSWVLIFTSYRMATKHKSKLKSKCSNVQSQNVLIITKLKNLIEVAQLPNWGLGVFSRHLSMNTVEYEDGELILGKL